MVWNHQAAEKMGDLRKKNMKTPSFTRIRGMILVVWSNLQLTGHPIVAYLL